MRSRADFIHARRDRNLSEGGGNVASIVITWDEWPEGSDDPVTGGHTGSPTQGSLLVRGFVHYVQPAVNTERKFAEIAVGDAILDLPPDVPIDGKENLAFTIGDQRWTLKDLNGNVPQSWDARVGDRPLFRTVLVRLAV